MEEEQKEASPASRSERGKGDDVNENPQPSNKAAVVLTVEEEEEKMARLAPLVFSNHVITDRIWLHLKFSDLKAASEVSRNFFESIRNFEGFKNHAVLNVSKESVVAIPSLLYKSKQAMMTKNWLGIQIEMDLPLGILDKIRDTLEHVKYVCLLPGQLTRWDAPKCDQKFLAALLSQSLLEEVSIPFEAWRNMDVTAVTLPRLKRLKVVLQFPQNPTFEAFLDRLPLLDELDVVVLDSSLFVSLAVNISLLEVIKRRCANLKKLYLKLRHISGVQGEVDWSFLAEMKHLKDFQINRRGHCRDSNYLFGTGQRFLTSLPKNQLERLSLQGIDDYCGFWNHLQGDPEPPLQLKLELLSGFRNLKRLSFDCCANAVDDDVMRFIVSEMTALEEFEVSHCSRLTDAGMAGNSEDGSDSIRNLKGLKEFSIGFCPLVTPDGLLSSLRLPFLRRFQYKVDDIVPKSFVVGIMSQNPSLESVAINFDEFSKEEVDNVQLSTITDDYGEDDNDCDDADDMLSDGDDDWWGMEEDD